MPFALTRRTALVGGAALVAPHPAPVLGVEVDLGAFPDTARWAREAAHAIPGWWAKIVSTLSVADFDRVRIQMREIEPQDVAALTIKNVINIDGGLVRAKRSSVDLMAHELVHVAQDYQMAPRPGSRRGRRTISAFMSYCRTTLSVRRFRARATSAAVISPPRYCWRRSQKSSVPGSSEI